MMGILGPFLCQKFLALRLRFTGSVFSFILLKIYFSDMLYLTLEIVFM